MLKGLRFRLSLLYLAASLGLVALLGAGTYGLLALYFQRSTDQALLYKMSTEFRLRGLTLPPDLVSAELAWVQQGTQPPAIALRPTTVNPLATPSIEAALIEQVASPSASLAALAQQVTPSTSDDEDIESQETPQPTEQEDPEDSEDHVEQATPQPPSEESPEGQGAPPSGGAATLEPWTSARSSGESAHEGMFTPEATGEENPERQVASGSTGEEDPDQQVTSRSSDEGIRWVPVPPVPARRGRAQAQLIPQPASADTQEMQPPPQTSIEEGDDSHAPPASTESPEVGDPEGDDRYDARLAPVFVVPQSGGVASIGVPAVNDPAAIAGALRDGSDLRTVTLGDGRRVRLLTYRVGGDRVLQVGRLLSDQDRLLAQYLTGLLLMGVTASVVLAIASWGMAGRSIKQAQRSWDQQQQFISNASHELRTPLTLLRANADYALRNRSPGEREKSLRDIIQECDYMDRMVEDLLLLSRLDAHRLDLVEDLIDLPAFLTELVRQVERIAMGKGVTLALDSVEGSVRGDKARIRQAMLVVLDNALRFTPSGGTIRLAAHVRGREVVISVADNGAGIPPEHLPHVFERFYQVPGRAGEGQGNGLGLSIARSLVEAHRGRIALSSQANLGTTVQIILPSAGPKAGSARSLRRE